MITIWQKWYACTLSDHSWMHVENLFWYLWSKSSLLHFCSFLLIGQEAQLHLSSKTTSLVYSNIWSLVDINFNCHERRRKGKLGQNWIVICLQALENAAILSVKVCWKDRTRKIPIGKLICADLLKTIAAVLLKAGLAKVPSKAPSSMTMVFTLRTMLDITLILPLFIIVATKWLERRAAVFCIYLSLHHWQLPGRFFAFAAFPIQSGMTGNIAPYNFLVCRFWFDFQLWGWKKLNNMLRIDPRSC